MYNFVFGAVLVLAITHYGMKKTDCENTGLTSMWEYLTEGVCEKEDK